MERKVFMPKAFKKNFFGNIIIIFVNKTAENKQVF